MTSPLQLTRPLVSFDTETTGLDVSRDRIIEISCVKLHPDMRREVWTQRLNPGCAISPEATAVHGITADDLVGMPGFADVAPIILAIMVDCDLTGFNIEKFDVPLLTAEFRRVGMVFPEGEVSIIDSGKIFWRHEARDLKGALKFYCGRSLTQAHSAEADAQAAADVLLAQVERYADLPDDVPGLEAWCHPHHPDWLDPDGKVAWLQGEAVITFGKHRNRSLRELAAEEPGYLQWICSKNFGEAVQGLCTEALAGNFPVRETQSQ